MPDLDARQHRRHAVEAHCIARSERDGRLLADRTLDVSYSGLRLAALGPAALGERIRISLELPGTKVWIDGAGRVERVIEGRRAEDRGAAIGVRVDRLDGMRRLLLAQVARHYPEVARSRGRQRDYAETVARIAASPR
jgi:hypothetical protein